MPYDPGISYQGGNYLFQGLSGLGRNIGSGIEDAQKKHDELARQLGESDTIVNYARAHNQMSPEDYTKYIGASATQKSGIAEGLAKNLALDAADRHQQAALQNAIDVARIHAAAAGAGMAFSTPEQVAFTQSYLPPGYTAAPGRGAPQIIKPEGDEGISVEDIAHKQVEGSGTDPVTNPAIYVTYNKKTNQPLKNQFLQNPSRAVDPIMAGWLAGLNMGGGGMPGGAPTFNVGGGAPGATAAPAPGLTPAPGTSPPAPSLAPAPANPFATPTPAFGLPPIAGATPAPPAPTGTVPTITTQADYDQLPSGSIYIAPDGSTKRKS
jgi:hypothetical protein